MSTAKIQLSKHELELVSNADLILTKNAIIKKLTLMLEELQKQQQQIIQRYNFPGEVLSIPYKISRGENYKGLPWLVLDHPRWFLQENIFAIRTLFWWGNYFSTTLHLAGEHKKQHGEKIYSAKQILADAGFYICISDDPWQHHFETDYFKPISELSGDELLKQGSKEFVKIAKKVPLNNIETALTELERDYEMIVGILSK